MPHRGDGPIPARIMIVGEAWGYDEEREGRPFVGASGQELNRMLHEAGIMRSECFVTNLVNHKPPNNDLVKEKFGTPVAWIARKKLDATKEHIPLRDKLVLPVVKEGYDSLLREIKMCEPNLIVPCGNWAMWALTGKFGINKWRGSLLKADVGPKLIPTIHPSSILQYAWSSRAAVINDLRRAAKHYTSREYNFPETIYTIRPSFTQAVLQLQTLLERVEKGQTWIEADLETGIRSKHIKCIGLSWSKLEAICIPFMALNHREGYWQLEEETQIIFLLYKLLTHPNALVRWQNGLFDAQYIHRYWHFVPNCAQDTMISQHSIYSSAPKSLAYMASIYAENYVFWKDEGKTEEDMPRSQKDEDEGWVYNCKDCTYTREVGEVEQHIVASFKGWEALPSIHAFQQEMFWPVLKAMLRGIRIIPENRNKLAEEVQNQLSIREEFFNFVVGQPLNPRSPKQMLQFFYSDLQQPPIKTRAKKGQPSHLTCDDDALNTIALREPLLKPITNAIQDIRTLEKYLDVILMKLDLDGRGRCSFNIGGSASGKSAPKTYRLSSSKSAFDSGANMQNISSEKSKSVGKAEKRGHIAMFGDPYHLPNVRAVFGPDPGYEFFDQDLERADLQVMAWDADEPLLKEALKKKVDLHLLNVYVIDRKDPPPLEELVETHPKYADHRGPRSLKREFAKVFCHATDYLGKSRTVAIATGRTIHEIDLAQKAYLGAYGGIKKWQDSIIEQVKRYRFVENKFGYRWYIFDRIDDQVMPEAVAWIPQSTVSIVINKIWMNHYKKSPWIEVLLQVHDSLAGQFPKHRREEALIQLQENAKIVIPYDDPLIIPTGIGTSTLSWGDC